MEWPQKKELDAMGEAKLESLNYEIGWFAEGAVDNLQLFRSDGNKSEKMGYGESRSINDVRSLEGTRKIKIGSHTHYDGLITRDGFQLLQCMRRIM